MATSNFQLDLDVCLKQFKKRKAANAKKKRIDNSSLPAGAPMYFYCKFCGDSTDTLPECYTCKPKMVCEPCDILYKHGLI